MSRPNSTAGLERLAGAALAVAATAAILQLPTERIPPGWLVAFTLPAALFSRSPFLARRPMLGGFAAIAVQVAACLIALQISGPLSRTGILSCTLLPPMTMVCVRRRSADAGIGLFLSFCVLVLGITLGAPQLPWLSLYGFTACLSLHTESTLRNATHARWAVGHANAVGWGRTLRVSLSLATLCLLMTTAMHGGLALLPTVHSTKVTAAAAREAPPDRSAPGLDNQFVLDGGAGFLGDLHGEQLVAVRSRDGAPVRDDLYLRTMFFAQAAMDRWEVGALGLARADNGRALHRPLPNHAVAWLEIERFAGALQFVPLPQDTCEVHELDHALCDVSREFFGQSEPSAGGRYQVAYQELPSPEDEHDVDPRGQRLGLLQLPENLDEGPWLALLARWRVRGSATQIASRITAGLQRNSRYERAEPVGPHAHAIENFLFNESERHGYCMHFATAAALLLRLANVPCRIAVGLYGGTADPLHAGGRVYGSQHAHAWVEIPFPGRGYVVFDPTPTTERGHAAPRDLPSAVSERALGFASLPPWLVVVFALLLLLLVRRAARTGLLPRKATAVDLRAPRQLLAALLRELARLGHARRAQQPLEQFARELAARQALCPEVHAAFAAYQEVRFGELPFTEARHELLRRACVVVSEQASARPAQPS